LRFKPGHKLQEGLYVRQDGTMAYYFSVEEIHQLFDRAGFDVIGETATGTQYGDNNGQEEDAVMQESADSIPSTGLAYVQRETVNRRREIAMSRIFVQGRFQRRSASCATAIPLDTEMNTMTQGVNQLKM
jgi:methyltransferase-like protein 6